MGYTKPYIPRADGAFRLWAKHLCHTLNESPHAYALMPAQTQHLMRLFNEFDAAYYRVTGEDTRNAGTIANKDDARYALEQEIRLYAALIRANNGITDADKIYANVRPRNTARSKRGKPGTFPLVQYVGSTPGIDLLLYHDTNTPDSKAKPRDAERLELWVAYAEAGQPLPKVSAAKPVGSFKKSKMLVDQDPLLDSRMGGTGKPTYWGRWVGYDGQPGAWSLAVSPSRQSVEAAKKAAEAKARQNAAVAQDDSWPDVDAIGLEGETDAMRLKRAA